MSSTELVPREQPARHPPRCRSVDRSMHRHHAGRLPLAAAGWAAAGRVRGGNHRLLSWWAARTPSKVSPRDPQPRPRAGAGPQSAARGHGPGGTGLALALSARVAWTSPAATSIGCGHAPEHRHEPSPTTATGRIDGGRLRARVQHAARTASGGLKLAPVEAAWSPCLERGPRNTSIETYCQTLGSR